MLIPDYSTNLIKSKYMSKVKLNISAYCWADNCCDTTDCNYGIIELLEILSLTTCDGKSTKVLLPLLTALLRKRFQLNNNFNIIINE